MRSAVMSRVIQSRRVWGGISIAVSSLLSLSSSLSHSSRSITNSFSSRASDSQIVVRAPSPWERCNAGQSSSTGVKAKSLSFSLPLSSAPLDSGEGGLGGEIGRRLALRWGAIAVVLILECR